jgi:Pentapeptide repeats (8 copies)
MAKSSSTREWVPRIWPADEAASAALREWLAGAGEAPFAGDGLDFSRADLSGADFGEGSLVDAVLRGTVLRDVRLSHARLDRSDFTGADLTGANLVDAGGRETVLRQAALRDATLRGCELFDADLSWADLTGALFGDGSFFRATLTGANLTNATADKLLLKETVFDSVEVSGFSGTVIGPVSVVLRGERTLLDGPDLEHWFGSRGARITRFGQGQ